MNARARSIFLLSAFVAAAPATAQDGFVLKSDDGANTLRLRGLIQVDSVFFRSDALVPGTDTTLVRRARPIVEATLGRIFEFRLTPDFGQGKTTLYDAYVDVRFHPAARVRAGKFRPPVGLERLQSAADTTFIVRAAPTLLVPNRDVGVQVHGATTGDAVTWALMASNGTPDGGSVDVDGNDGKEFAGRVFAHPLPGMGVGISGTRGRNEGSTADSGLGAYKTPGDRAFFSYRSDGTVTGTTVADGTRTRWSPQAYAYVGRFGLMTEYVSSTQKIRLDGNETSVTHTAWQVSFSALLTDDRASYRGFRPARPFALEGPGKGAVALAARYSRLDLDDDAFPVFADPARSARRGSEWAMGVSWWMTGNFRLMLNYDRTVFRGGAPGGTDRETENVILSRFQLSF